MCTEELSENVGKVLVLKATGTAWPKPPSPEGPAVVTHAGAEPPARIVQGVAREGDGSPSSTAPP